jgi:hypothetical protein
MILDSILIKKRFFDPRSEQDMNVFRHFVENHSWGGKPCPFFLEFPYTTIPDMIKDKITHNLLELEFDRFHHIGV